MRDESPAVSWSSGVEEWPSGQWQQTVNLPTNVYVGSNPTSSTTAARLGSLSKGIVRGYSTMVVQQPSKLRMPVRSRLPAPYFEVSTMRRGAKVI